MSKCRCVGGLEDAWEEIQGTGGGETCGTPQNTYWYCCHIGIAVILVLLPYWYRCHIGIAVVLVLLLYWYCCCFILPSSNQRVSMLRWTHNSTIAEQKEYPRGKRIDYILHSAGRGRNCKVTAPNCQPSTHAERLFIEENSSRETISRCWSVLFRSLPRFRLLSPLLLEQPAHTRVTFSW